MSTLLSELSLHAYTEKVSAFEHNLERRRLSSSYDLNVDKPTAGREVSAFEHNLERRRLSSSSYDILHCGCIHLAGFTAIWLALQRSECIRA